MAVRYLKRDKETGRLSYRREFPAPLRPFVPGGRREVKVSLGTTDFAAPGASSTFEGAAREYDRLEQLAIRAKEGRYDPLDDPTINYIIDLYRSRELRRDAIARANPELRGPYDDREAHGVAIDGYSDAYEQAQERPHVAVEMFEDDVHSFSAEIGKRFDPSTDAFRSLCLNMLATALQMAKEKNARDHGRIVRTPDEPLPPVGTAPAGTKRHHRTVGDLIDAYEADKKDGWAPGTTSAYAPVWDLLRAHFADIDVTSISRDDARAFRDMLRTFPRDIKKHPELRQLSIKAAIHRAQELALPSISAKTINERYLGTTKGLFGWAEAEHWITSSPFKRLSVADNVADVDKRHPFTTDQLKALCNAAPWKPIDPNPGGKPIRFWAPLIALFQGMRVGEIAQLRVEDIQTVDNIPVIVIRSGEDQRVKTENSRRRLPVHPMLRDMGFLDYVNHQRKAKAQQLFPGEKPNTKGQWGDQLSKWFGRLLESRKITGRKLGMHSFRHNFEDRLREAGLHGTAIGQELTGRASLAGDSSGYGTGVHPVKVLNEALSKIDYPDLDLSHIQWSHGS